MRQQLEFAGFFKQFVLRPGVGGAFEYMLADVDKAGLFEPGDVVGVAGDWTVVGAGGFGYKGGPGGEGVGREESVIVRSEAAVEFLQLEVAAGFYVSVSLRSVLVVDT